GNDFVLQLLGRHAEAGVTVTALAEMFFRADGEDGHEEEGEPRAGAFREDIRFAAALRAARAHGRLGVVGDNRPGAKKEDESATRPLAAPPARLVHVQEGM